MASGTYAQTHRKIDRGAPAAAGPVYADADGVWHVNGYAAARAVLRSTDTRQGGLGVDLAGGKMPAGIRPPVAWRDGPEHREDRRQTARFFTPRRVEEHYRDLMHRLADEQCARLRRQGTADVSQLSFSLAVAVAAEVIGLTPARRGMARRLERFFADRPTPPGWRSPAGVYETVRSHVTLAAFHLFDVAPVIRARRRRRRDDLISHLLDQGCGSGAIFGECLTFATAGMVTTREFIVLAAWHLLTDDALRSAYVRGDDGQRSALLHELLRLEPVGGNLYRWATADVVVPGPDGPVTIPAGARVDIDLTATNLDPSAVGADPAQLCPGRSLPAGVAEAGLAFGEGPHRCPGAYIAIQETDIFLRKLLALPGLRMVRPPQSRIRVLLKSYELTGLVVTVR